MVKGFLGLQRIYVCPSEPRSLVKMSSPSSYLVFRMQLCLLPKYKSSLKVSSSLIWIVHVHFVSLTLTSGQFCFNCNFIRTKTSVGMSLLKLIFQRPLTAFFLGFISDKIPRLHMYTSLSLPLLVLWAAHTLMASLALAPSLRQPH